MRTEVYFRLDAGARTGGGHLSRCLTLAQSLAKRASVVRFLCATLDQVYRDLIATRGFEVTVVDGGARAFAAAIVGQRDARRVLVVDHYQIDAAWERELRKVVDRIIVIDDLADRPHECDVLLDAAYAEDGSRYVKLIPAGCLGLFGTRFSLLRPEFAELRASRTQGWPAQGDGYIVHLFFGSEDTHENTLRFAPLVLQVAAVRELRVAVSSRFRNTFKLDEISKASGGRMSWRVAGDAMAEHMAGCDVAIGSPGHATWERACLGLPGAYLAVADNQVSVLQRLHEAAFCMYLGADRSIADEAFKAGVAQFLASAETLCAMRGVAMSAVDGLGCDRVAAAVLATGRAS